MPLGQLGDFRFALYALPYQEIERIAQYQFAEIDRLNQPNLLQAVGEVNQTITITGEFAPEFYALHRQTGPDVPNPFDRLRFEAQKQQPLLLVTEDGVNLGYWVILEVNTSANLFKHNQGARRVPFSIQIKFYSPDFAAIALAIPF